MHAYYRYVHHRYLVALKSAPTHARMLWDATTRMRQIQAFARLVLLRL